MFGKNKKEEAPQEPENIKTETIEAKDEKSHEEQLTAEDKRLLALIKTYKEKYDGVYSANDFLSVNQAFVEAEKLNIGFATYAEIVALREDIKELTKTVKQAANSLPN